MRLFFECFLVARKKALSDDETGIAICIAPQMALLAKAERRPSSIAAHGLSLGIPHDESMAAMAFSGRVARIDPAGDHPQVPSLIFGVGEDSPLHP